MKLTFLKFAVFPGTLGVLCACASSAAAQQNPPRGVPTLELDGLYQAAIDADPRYRALQLQSAQTELRLRNIEAERLPSIAAEGLRSINPTRRPRAGPGGRPLFSASKDTYDAHVRIDQRIGPDHSAAPRRRTRPPCRSAGARRTTLFDCARR